MSDPRIDTDPDYIALKRFDYSLQKALERYPDGLPAPLVAQALDTSESGVQAEYTILVARIREALGVVI